jgi:hypothetical protein
LDRDALAHQVGVPGDGLDERRVEQVRRAVVVEGLPAGRERERAEAVEAGGEAGAVDVVVQGGDAAQLVGEGLPRVGLVRDLDAGLFEQVEVVEDRERVEVLGDAVDAAVDGVGLDERVDEGARCRSGRRAARTLPVAMMPGAVSTGM